MTVEQQTEPPKGPIGLGGWMILPVIALVLSPIWIGVGVVFSFKILFSGAFFTLASGPQVFIVLEMAVSILDLAAWIYAAYLCFTWDGNFPKIYILLLAANLLVQIVDVAIGAGVFDGKVTDQEYREIGRGFLACLIWTPYMMYSRRVQNTFKPVP